MRVQEEEVQGVGVGRGAAGADGAGEEVCGEDFHCGWVLVWEGGLGGEGSGERCGCALWLWWSWSWGCGGVWCWEGDSFVVLLEGWVGT